jgi:peptidoglycan/xylan/chitin deacetylase (PgdA/CDA1 family)
MNAFAALLIGFLTAMQSTGSALFPAAFPKPAPPPLPTDSSGKPLRIPIFIYHTIATTSPKETATQEAYSTEPQLLEEQLTYLDTHGYTTVTMKDAADMLRRGTTSPIAKPVVLTFDDGWVSQFKNAVPLLLAHHAKAVFYIYPNPIGKDPRFMTWDDLAALRDDGMEIADHTLTHPLLSKQSPEQLHHEMYDSKLVLEQRLGISVTNFASPFGYTNDAVVTELKADGYETGRTVTAGAIHAATSTYALSGFIVHHDMHDFEWILEYAK